MENTKVISAPVILKGLNYLLWSRTMKTTLCSRGLWSHTLLNEAPLDAIEEADSVEQGIVKGLDKWFQEDQLVLAILQNSLESSLLEAYSYCDTTKDLWDTLKNVYGNSSNLMRIYEVKKALNDLHQDDMEFTKVFGKYRALWAELEMLRPNSIDPAVINERREQDKVFGLLMVLNSNYSDLIKHLLREDKLPSLEDVCAKVQKEQGAHGLFGGQRELVAAHKVWHKPDDKKGVWCDHCKKKGHPKDKCWILHPHLKPSKWKDQKAHMTQETISKLSPFPQGGSGDGSKVNNTFPIQTQGGAFQSGPYHIQSYQGGSQFNPLQSGASSSKGSFTPNNSYGGPRNAARSLEGDVQALASAQQEMVKKSDLEALIKALKDSGISLSSGHTFTASINGICNMSNALKPLIVDSGASHHMISDKFD